MNSVNPSTAQPITTREGVAFQPWSNGYAVGFRATHPDGRTEYLYLNPSSAVDEGSADVFVYQGTTGDPDQDRPCHFYDLFTEPATRSHERAQFLADMITTAVEGGINYWAAVSDYRWYCPTLDGGSAPPGPDGTANAHATIHEDDTEGDGRVLPIGLDELERALDRIAAGPVKEMNEKRRSRIRAAYLADDATETDLDSADADDIMQVACFGQVIYG